MTELGGRGAGRVLVMMTQVEKVADSYDAVRE